MARWNGLCTYLYDGILEIDNNLVENAIRPVALGRKNYLFAGSHQAAQRAAVIYSFFAICKKHEVTLISGSSTPWRTSCLSTTKTSKTCTLLGGKLKYKRLSECLRLNLTKIVLFNHLLYVL